MIRSLIFLALITAGVTAAAYFKQGDFSLVGEGFKQGWQMGLRILPLLAIAFTLAGMIQVVIPPEVITKWIGTESGSKGLFLASALGAIMPGGPITNFPIISALHKAGADIAPIAAFIFSWSMIGVHRMVIWELPLMGPKFAFSRLAAACLLPPLLGLMTKLIFNLVK
jgi:uncharacterized membrane protein YraQ (UPF0718 family)